MKRILLLDDLFAAIDALARKLGVPRSQLVAEALAEYVAKHGHARVTEQLDAVYAVKPAIVPQSARRAQQCVLRRSEW